MFVSREYGLHDRPLTPITEHNPQSIVLQQMATELWEAIFDYACWGDGIIFTTGTKRLPTEVAISHVSRRWRAIALQYGPLWARLTFDEMPPFAKTRAYIQRSKNQPLHINVEMTSWKGQGPKVEELEPGDDINTHVPVYYESFVHRAFEILSPHVNRWWMFSLITLDPALMKLALYYITKLGGAPILESLNLAVNRPDVEAIDEVPEDFYTGVLFKGNHPRLTRVHLMATPIDWSGPLFRHLEMYTVCRMRPSSGPWFDDLLRTFEASPKLKELRFRYAGPQVDDGDGWTDRRTVQLKELETVFFEFADPCEASNFMDRLYLPSLCHLRLSFGKPFVGDPSDPFDIEEPRQTQYRQSMTGSFLKGLSLPQWHEDEPKGSIFATIFTLQLINAEWDWKRKVKSEESALSISRRMLKELDWPLRILALHNASPSFLKLLTMARTKNDGLNVGSRAYCPKLHVLIVGDLGETSIGQVLKSRHQLGAPIRILVAPRRMQKEVEGTGMLKNDILKEVEYYDEIGDVDFNGFVKSRFFDMVTSRDVSSMFLPYIQ